jgi:hypothetical protein
MHMAVMDLTRYRVERLGETRSRGDAQQRAKARMQTVLEIGGTFAVLVLIMVGALAVRLLLSLPLGVAH